VLFATGYISPEIEAGMARGEISGLIMKPYELDDVVEKIALAIKTAAPVIAQGSKFEIIS